MRLLTDKIIEWLFKAGLIELTDPQVTGHAIGYRRGLRAARREGRS